MLTILLTLYSLNANISYPTEGYEVGSGQEKEYLIHLDEPTTYFPDENESFVIIPKKGKKAKKMKTKKAKKTKTKKAKYFSNTIESGSLFGIVEAPTTNLVIASLGGVMVVAGMVLVARNYCEKRSGYQHINPMQDQGLGYGTLENVYN